MACLVLSLDGVMIKQIIFDFDGVILDSLPIKEAAFRHALNNYPDDKVERLVGYHQKHGGVSRFEKFRYFFQEILMLPVDEEVVQTLSEIFSKYCKKELADKKYLITETVDFILNNYQKYPCHVASGTEQNELRYLCDALGLSDYFVSIMGSPTAKAELVKNILQKQNYVPEETLLIGDAMTDYNAAKDNGLFFSGYNNLKFENLSDYYIFYFKKLDLRMIG